MAEYIERKRAVVDACNALELYPSEYAQLEDALNKVPAADVAPVVHGSCKVCSGKDIISQDDCDKGYSLEIDAEQRVASVWNGDTCVAIFPIKYCPNCGKMLEEDSK